MPDHPESPSILGSIEIIGKLDEETLGCEITHLQLPKKLVGKINEFHIRTIGELAGTIRKFHEGKLQTSTAAYFEFYWIQHEREIGHRLQTLASAIRNGKPDWPAFWNSIGYDFTFAAARLDYAFGLDEKTRSLRIEALNLGKAVFSFNADQIHTVGDLVDRLAHGLPDYRGFGKNKMWQFACGLREFIATINSEGTSSSLVANSEDFPIPGHTGNFPIPKYRGVLQYTARNRQRMSESAKSLTLGQLHLHKEIPKLHRIGVESLEQLFTLFEDGLPIIRGAGKMARINLLKTVTCADNAISESGDMDWDLFAQIADIPAFPDPEVPLNTGSDFLASLDGVVLNLTTQCFDEVESATLVDRLIPSKKASATLEELGSRFGVTRERIRQKQKKVIESLSAAVLENDYQNLSFRFTQRFSQFWRDAAKHFGQNDAITYQEFIEGLTEVWKVKRHQIIPHLPLIYAFLTSNSTLPSEFNNLSSFPPEVFGIKSPQDLGRPFNSLHPTKSLAKAADKSGVRSLGQFLGALQSGSFTTNKTFIDALTSTILLPLSKAVTPQGGVAWQEYYRLKGIPCIPVSESNSPASFVEQAVEAMATFINETEITGRSKEIFRHRIVPESAERKTLYETGALLGCAGPQIKREENELLERLHDAIFADDYTAAGVHFSDPFVQHWKKARKVYRQAKTQLFFAELLSIEWDLPASDLLKIVPMIACVVEGRPQGYTGKRFLNPSPSITAADQIDGAPVVLSVVRLRGFRSVH